MPRRSTQRPGAEYYVYVIGLDDAVTRHRRFRDANPNHDPSKPCVYVGQSVLLPEKRFEQHLNDYKANRFVRDYGQELLPRVYDPLNPIGTREEAERVEAELAEELRARHWGVWSH